MPLSDEYNATDRSTVLSTITFALSEEGSLQSKQSKIYGEMLVWQCIIIIINFYYGGDCLSCLNWLFHTSYFLKVLVYIIH